MSCFGIGINTNKIDSGELRGKKIPVACKVWFTVTGKLIPLSFKFEGDDGELQTVSNLKITVSEDKCYLGIQSKEYKCQALIGGIYHHFKLVFYCDTCKWMMVI